MRTEVITVTTGRARRVYDLTESAARFVSTEGDGLLSVFVPHATAGLALIETGAGSDIDLIERIDAMLPRRDDLYRHQHGAEGHGADHVVPAFISPSLTVPVISGELGLGIWQSIVLVDVNEDNPQRSVRFSFLPA